MKVTLTVWDKKGIPMDRQVLLGHAVQSSIDEAQIALNMLLEKPAMDNWASVTILVKRED